MTARGRGRPSSDGNTVSPERILSDALSILDADGLDRLTMRALAVRVGINPMTIYHHFKDRDGLIRSLAEWVYADVAAPETDDANARLRGLLMAYYSKVVLHPALTLAIFARPSVFPDHATRITENLISLLNELGLSSQRSLRWTHILVDYVHGAALAVAAREGNQRRGPMLDDFESGLAELLKAFVPSPDRSSD
ncbi:TetR family transcriptional regulator [Paramesorhizobium deserti]|uniref:TetR family transcriptional regulator n=1 Tax=Paramesorhizobium deserti TaxID=1494590 RepID=A0A135HTI5_9HYPH|nr:TetR/AcrR family transcriptional regulator [Paramesorhizobium deserti]KXF76502.1 TetR family transcriptional regulator [Paramesorhizobium deserti]